MRSFGSKGVLHSSIDSSLSTLSCNTESIQASNNSTLPTFGIEGYRAPVNKPDVEDIKLGRFSLKKNITYLEKYLQLKKPLPDSTKYSKIRNWTRANAL